MIFDASNNEMPSQCHISLDDFIHGEELLQIRQCKHIFKPPGLRRWLSQHSKCPVCRCDVTLNGIFTQQSTENTNTQDMLDHDNENTISDEDEFSSVISQTHAQNDNIDNITPFVREYRFYDNTETADEDDENNLIRYSFVDTP